MVHPRQHISNLSAGILMVAASNLPAAELLASKFKPEHDTANSMGPCKSQEPDCAVESSVSSASSVRKAEAIYESRYTTEGRDNLDGSSFLSAFAEILLSDTLTFEPWIGHSHDAEYTELNLNLAYVIHTTGLVDFYTVYTYLVFDQPQPGTEDDHEIEAGMRYLGAGMLDIIARAYYSFEAEGTFIQLSTYNERTFSDKTALRTVAWLGYNAGYVINGHDGFNNFQMLAELTHFTTRNIELKALAGYNFAINRDPTKYTGDETLRDFFWGGIGLSWYFQ